MFDIYQELSWRGLIHQCTDEAFLPQWLSDGCRTVYVGFDPTADSLHVGSLMPLLYLRRFQRAGHRPIALVGGATGMIGDPSGKSQERNLLSVDQLEHNVAGLRKQMQSFLDFDCGESSAVLINNFDWMKSFSYLEFLRDIGKNFPVNVMMNKDSVKGRLERSESGLSYTEFSYMLLQAYDFVHLHDQLDCQLQVGGSDQWGNITAGIDLGRRMRSVQLYGITCPLLTKSDGSKMGKTESGTIWLSPDRTSPYEFYQYWYNVADDDAGKCLRFLTDLSQEEIEGLDQARDSEPQKRESQIRLAEELTKLVHGDSGLEIAIRAKDVLFGAEISQLSDEQLGQIFADVPSCALERERLGGVGISLVDAMVESGLAKSKSEARRTLKQGGAYVNNHRESDLDRSLSEQDLASETTIVLRSGKKKYALLRFK
ncbi:MAG: tyrosine--tRNA ligase [Planctomycetaceae bacterium]|nr:tyrosine--tRNA ligase [Planctomycetaceae bacterium]